MELERAWSYRRCGVIEAIHVVTEAWSYRWHEVIEGLKL